MPDLMDAMQDDQLRESDALHARARNDSLDIAPPDARDCDCCGEPISKARLQAVPTAEACVECAEALEIAKRQYALR